MRRWIMVLFLALLWAIAFPPQAARAQEQPDISSLQVDIWPEYDQPAVLVIYRVTLSSAVALPAQVSLYIPRPVEKPYNVAMQDVDGLLYTLDYTTAIEGDWQRVTFTTPSAQIQLEYYDPLLVREGSIRNFTYHWPGNNPVESFTVQVQQPLNATQMQITPDMGKGQQGSDGLLYYSTHIGKVELGTALTIRIRYVKPDDTLGPSSLSVQPIEPITQQALGRTTFVELVPWGLGVLGLLLIAAGVFWYWQSEGGVKISDSRTLHNLSKPKETRRVSEQGTIYCQQCGKRALPGDLFCRSCGTKLRTE
jgi:hypothetical protein